MNSRKKIGFLGGGGMLNAHARVLLQHIDKCAITAVAEPDESKYPRIKKILGDDIKIVPDYMDLAQSKEIDAVVILLPHDLHMPAVIAAAEAGKEIMTEKVMARNVYECDKMIEACDKAGVSLTVCHDRRYHGEWVALKNIVDSGSLGEILYWKLEHNQNVCTPEGSWMRSRNKIGGGSIMSCLTHQIDALRWYEGEFDSLTCMTKTYPERMEGEAMGIIAAQMKSGAMAQLSINWMTHSNRGDNSLWYELCHVCGTKGEAYYMFGKGTYAMLFDESEKDIPWSYEGGGDSASFRKVASEGHTGHEGCLTEWVKMLNGEENKIITSGRECRGTVEVAEAAYRSVEMKQNIQLPIDPQPWVDK